MCLVSTAEILTRLSESARRTLEALEHQERATGAATTVRNLGRLLAESEPLISPSPRPVVGQLTAESLVRRTVSSYPALLDQLIGPPLQVGVEDWLGYVAAECAVAALRQDELQAALSMLFLSTLCAPSMEDPAIEALDHILTMSDATGSVGLLARGARRTAMTDDAVTRLRGSLSLMFVTTAVQINGTWGRAEPTPVTVF